VEDSFSKIQMLKATADAGSLLEYRLANVMVPVCPDLLFAANDCAVCSLYNIYLLICGISWTTQSGSWESCRPATVVMRLEYIADEVL